MQNGQVVYVVLEESYGCGPSCVGVYLSQEEADDAVGESNERFVVERVVGE